MFDAIWGLMPPAQAAAVGALFQVLMIDLVLAGDNAVAVGLAAGRLPSAERRKVILLGLAAAVVLRIGFALITTQLLAVIGLLLAGGILLLWVCWKMWRELRAGDREAAGGASAHANIKPAQNFRDAFLQILIADVSMSLDNVLAVAGAAREHPAVLVFGLLLSIGLMGLAANWIAKLLNRFRWIGYLGLLIVLYVALHMMWEGARTVAIDLHRTAQFNSYVPSSLAIDQAEIDRRLGHHK